MIKKIFLYIYYVYIMGIKKRKDLLNYYNNKKLTIEQKKIIDSIKQRKSLSLVSYEFTKEYDPKKIKVYKTKDCDYPYVFHDGKKLFLKNNPFKLIIKRTYNYLKIEQDKRSPHKYTDEKFKLDNNTVLFEVGAAEGIFALENIDKCKKVYIFECDKEWIKILNETFKPYMDKVVIIEKYVGDKVSGNFITLDSYINELDKDDNIFIKMDIEGAEVLALIGSEKLINTFSNVKLAVCTYHNQDDEEKIRKIFKKEQYIVENTPGYLTPYSLENFNPPYLRRGLLRIKRRKTNGKV